MMQQRPIHGGRAAEDADFFLIHELNHGLGIETRHKHIGYARQDARRQLSDEPEEYERAAERAATRRPADIELRSRIT